jgi:hypothetical protein
MAERLNGNLTSFPFGNDISLNIPIWFVQPGKFYESKKNRRARETGKDL